MDIRNSLMVHKEQIRDLLKETINKFESLKDIVNSNLKFRVECIIGDLYIQETYLDQVSDNFTDQNGEYHSFDDCPFAEDCKSEVIQMIKNVRVDKYTLKNKIIYRENESDVQITNLLIECVDELKKFHWIRSFKAYYKAFMIKNNLVPINNGDHPQIKGKIKWPEEVMKKLYTAIYK
jgi:hypothetical protein